MPPTMKDQKSGGDGRRIGYARVSTDEQHLDLQLDALARSGVASSRIYTDVASGKNTQRKRLEACFRVLRDGDTLVVWRLDRLGRSLQDLVRIIGDLERKGVAFESLTERIETRSASGKLVFHVFAALAEFERNLIRERTRAGLAAARARGRKGGRRPKLTPSQVKEIVAKVNSKKMPVDEIARTYGVSRTTVYSVLSRWRQNKAAGGRYACG
jgi:DNA invertase Pin-like site-specific DNA recombinase